MSNKCLYIPREINTEYILLWKRDEALFLFLPVIFILTLQNLLGFVLALVGIIIMGQILKQLSLDKPSGYMLHWVKYNIPKQYVSSVFSRQDRLELKQSLLFKGDPFPSSHLRHLAG